MPPGPQSLGDRLKTLLADTHRARPRAEDLWRRTLLEDKDLGWALANDCEPLMVARVRVAILRQYGGAPSDLPRRTAGALAWLGVDLVARRPAG